MEERCNATEEEKLEKSHFSCPPAGRSQPPTGRPNPPEIAKPLDIFYEGRPTDRPAGQTGRPAD